jgi:uncharacterized protein (TIGR03435 family)
VERPIATVIAITSLAGLYSISLRAQAVSELKPKFEVASIRACTNAAPGQKGGGLSRFSGETIAVNCQSVMSLITTAYVMYGDGRTFNLYGSTIVEGGPAWIQSARYAINAKTESEVPQPVMNGPMMQALLEDRFKLKTHRETREIPVYALTVAKGGIKFPRHREGSCVPPPPFDPARTTPPPALQPGQRRCAMLGIPAGPIRTVNAEGITIQQFTRLFLRNVPGLDKPVVDKTGVTGSFDFHLQYANPELRARHGDVSDPAAPSIFTALGQLGLKLESTKAPGEFLVVDQIERPDEN